MNTEEKFKLIKRGTAEIITEDSLRDLLEKKAKPTVYLGTSTTGSPHIGYFVWAIKLSDFLKAGFKAKILLADIHGALDKTPWDMLQKRYDYYKKVIPVIFESLGMKKSDIEFVKGSDVQLKKDYILDLLKASTLVSMHDAHKSASEVVKMGENPKLSGVIYPLMQALDEQYLDADVQCGGLDQRKIFVLASELLPKMGYKKRVHVMTPIVPGLIGKKMSSSEEKGKIDLLDSEEEVNKKINGAECEAGNPDNGVLAFIKEVVFPLREKITIKRPEKYGGNISYKTFSALENDFIKKKVHPLDLKKSLAEEINSLLKPFRKDSSLENLKSKAYPLE